MTDQRPIPVLGVPAPATPIIDVDARMVGFDEAAVGDQVRILTEIEASLRQTLSTGQ